MGWGLGEGGVSVSVCDKDTDKRVNLRFFQNTMKIFSFKYLDSAAVSDVDVDHCYSFSCLSFWQVLDKAQAVDNFAQQLNFKSVKFLTGSIIIMNSFNEGSSTYLSAHHLHTSRYQDHSLIPGFYYTLCIFLYATSRCKISAVDVVSVISCFFRFRYE